MQTLQVISLTYDENIELLNPEETVAAIGFFDGIHKGHQKVIKKAQSLAEQQNRKSAVITFSPHPSVVLNNKKAVHYLTPLPEKKAILEEMGIDILYIIKFDKQLSQVLPEDFIQHFMIKLQIKHLVTGFDFTYGHKGKGNVHTLPEHAKGNFNLTVIEKLEDEGEKVSSTRIRQLLQEGNVQKISELMERPFVTSGVVIAGEQRGTSLGYPTANIEPEATYALPKVGVYGVKVHVQGQYFYGMANVGYKPTFHELAQHNQPILEVHLFDFNQSIYGKQLKIEWHVFIRDEQKFAEVEDLVKQLAQDEAAVRHFFSTI